MIASGGRAVGRPDTIVDAQVFDECSKIVKASIEWFFPLVFLVPWHWIPIIYGAVFAYCAGWMATNAVNNHNQAAMKWLGSMCIAIAGPGIILALSWIVLKLVKAVAMELKDVTLACEFKVMHAV